MFQRLPPSDAIGATFEVITSQMANLNGQDLSTQEIERIFANTPGNQGARMESESQARLQEMYRQSEAERAAVERMVPPFATYGDHQDR